MKKGNNYFIILAVFIAVAAAVALTHRNMPVVVSVKQNVAVPVTQGKALPRLLDLGAGKCIPCKMMKPILEEFKETCSDRFKTEFIDVWESPDYGKRYGVNLIPTQIFFGADGKELFRHEGFFAKDDILAKWKELGVEL